MVGLHRRIKSVYFFYFDYPHPILPYLKNSLNVSNVCKFCDFNKNSSALVELKSKPTQLNSFECIKRRRNSVHTNRLCLISFFLFFVFEKDIRLFCICNSFSFVRTYCILISLGVVLVCFSPLHFVFDVGCSDFLFLYDYSRDSLLDIFHCI